MTHALCFPKNWISLRFIPLHAIAFRCHHCWLLSPLSFLSFQILSCWFYTIKLKMATTVFISLIKNAVACFNPWMILAFYLFLLKTKMGVRRWLFYVPRSSAIQTRKNFCPKSANARISEAWPLHSFTKIFINHIIYVQFRDNYWWMWRSNFVGCPVYDVRMAFG